MVVRFTGFRAQIVVEWVRFSGAEWGIFSVKVVNHVGWSGWGTRKIGVGDTKSGHCLTML